MALFLSELNEQIKINNYDEKNCSWSILAHWVFAN